MCTIDISSLTPCICTAGDWNGQWCLCLQYIFQLIVSYVQPFVLFRDKWLPSWFCPPSLELVLYFDCALRSPPAPPLLFFFIIPLQGFPMIHSFRIKNRIYPPSPRRLSECGCRRCWLHIEIDQLAMLFHACLFLCPGEVWSSFGKWVIKTVYVQNAWKCVFKMGPLPCSAVL